MDKWHVTDSHYAYKSPYGNLRIDTCRLPDDRVCEYGVSEYLDWVNIFALNEKKEIVMVKQYRHGAGDIFIELVAGSVEDGEAPEDTVVRELREETGYVCLSKPILLGKFHYNPARQNNVVHIFFCDNTRKEHDQNLDELEDIEVVHVPFSQIDKLVRDGVISQLSSVTAIELVKKHIDEVSL